MSEIWSTLYSGVHVKYQLFFSEFNETWIFLADFRKILKYQISRKSIQWEPSFSIPTDRTKLIAAFRNFANAHNTTRHSSTLARARIEFVTPRNKDLLSPKNLRHLSRLTTVPHFMLWHICLRHLPLPTHNTTFTPSTPPQFDSFDVHAISRYVTSWTSLSTSRVTSHEQLPAHVAMFPTSVTAHKRICNTGCSPASNHTA
jgi:hypothetical protein